MNITEGKKIKILVLDSKYGKVISKNIMNGIDNIEILFNGNAKNPNKFINLIKEKKPDYIIFEHWYYDKGMEKYIPLGDVFLNSLYQLYSKEITSVKKIFGFLPFGTKKERKVSNFFSKFISINPQGNKIRKFSEAYNKFTIHGFIKDKSLKKIVDRIESLEKRKNGQK